MNISWGDLGPCNDKPCGLKSNVLKCSYLCIFVNNCNGIQTNCHLLCKRTLNHLAKGLSVRLRNKWLWVRNLLQSLKVQEAALHKYSLLCNFIEIALRHGCSPVNLLHIFKIPFFTRTPLEGCFYVSDIALGIGNEFHNLQAISV